ncbi:S1/P1 nuclease [Bythopirellula polymerisocia]|uniref:S1/P1 Nuclease n=1 Tax=Bythopirellula polymerisocia TaxID=2528003 RepID=A0A5C6CZ13_9BACT|nr:S1/P1 nuclease [Bythopirellula polymerisocia]TWU29638.1 S1/P1 Nuclease [Bythopirellula polymerisocia]
MIYRIAIFLILISQANYSHAWSESGHHLVALLAFDQLNPDEQKQLLEMLTAHPRYQEDFTPPPKVRDIDRFRVGTAGYWPDIARSQPKYNRPTWHYQLGATLKLGFYVNVPETPGPLPQAATLKTQKLYIAQAVELCRKVMADTTSPSSDRAIALCWLAHLVGDAHQPCHAGSLYAERLFPDGDRGANSIPCKQKNNMHALWDAFLGEGFDEGTMNRRVKWISSKPDYEALGKDVLARERTLDPLTWLEESREASREYAYTPEVLGPIKAMMKSPLEPFLPIDFSETYLQQAGNLSQHRAAEAGVRLAEVWREGLTGPSLNTKTDAKSDSSEYDFGDGFEPAVSRSRSTHQPPKAAALTHWLNINTNVRHNSDCKNFENTKHGRLCSPNEGKPCGICGG